MKLNEKQEVLRLRNNAMFELYQQGKILLEIGEIYNLTKQRVQQILKDMKGYDEIANKNRRENIKKLGVDLNIVEKRKNTMLLLKQNPEFKEKLRRVSSETMKRLRQDPIFKEKHRKALVDKRNKSTNRESNSNGST